MAYTAKPLDTEKSPEQILKEAAEAAQKLIPAAEKERDALQRKLVEAEMGLTRLRAVVSVYPALSKQALQTMSSTVTTTSTASGTVVTTQAAAPSAYIKMHVIFEKADRPLTVKEIIESFKIEFGEDIPQSTLYFALNKGKHKRTFVEENNKWRLAKKLA